MTVIATALRHLMAAGVTGDALVAAIEEIEAAQIEQATPKRSSGARRQAEYRERVKAQKEAEDITRDVTHVTNITPDPSPKKQQSNPIPSPPLKSPPSQIEALEAWNGMAERTGLPKALSATGKRQAALRARLAEHGMDGFRQAVAAVERSDFCRGENQRGWRADLTFMLRPDNFQKLIEGGFDSAKPRAPPSDLDVLMASVERKYGATSTVSGAH